MKVLAVTCLPVFPKTYTHGCNSLLNNIASHSAYYKNQVCAWSNSLHISMCESISKVFSKKNVDPASTVA
uniref:Uncharacterized protein n=1 Tax=Anguilla anguilla TaxID=7936 RepID=A0A0E9PL41_ANGAN